MFGNMANGTEGIRGEPAVKICGNAWRVNDCARSFERTTYRDRKRAAHLSLLAPTYLLPYTSSPPPPPPTLYSDKVALSLAHVP